jgi:hypothetical protein
MNIRKTVLTVTVLSPEGRDLSNYSLDEIAREIFDGDSIGQSSIAHSTILTDPKAVRTELKAIGNDGSFFDEI